MATAQEGGTTGYSGAGAGGKFRKKPLRRQTTPYDRPTAAAVRPNAETDNDKNGNWLTKLVLDPASRLISYGANRFFASVLRKRLPPPPSNPQPPEVNHVISEGTQGAGTRNQIGTKELAGGESIRPMDSLNNKGVSELEQFLKQKTFSRSEIDHLTELLQSRATEGSLGAEYSKKDIPENGGLNDNRSEGMRLHGVASTPISEAKVLEDSLGSPAELAKAYMGSRPSKVSPSMLGMHGQIDRAGTGLLSNVPFASKSPSMSLTTKTSVSLGAPENGFLTPRSRGRSAIYNMARAPYSRVRATSAHAGNGVKNDGYSGLPMLSQSPSQVPRDEKLSSKLMTLKRRSSAVDDEVGSVGPVRRIRQKHNLFSPGNPLIAHGVGSRSAKQKLPLILEPRESEYRSMINSSYPNVPSKSSEVASRILQQLDNLAPKEISSAAKIVASQEKSPFKLTSSMLRGQALRSLEDVDSSRLLLNDGDDHKSEDRSYATLANVRDSTFREPSKVEDVPKEVVHLGTENPRKVYSGAIQETNYLVVSNGVSEPPQKKRAFRMSAQEDYLDLDDDVHCNGTALVPFSEARGQLEDVALSKSVLPPTEDPRFVETVIPPLVKPPSDFVLSKTSQPSEHGSVKLGEGSTGLASRDPVEASSASESVLPLSAATLDQTGKANSFPPLYSFSPKAADGILPLPSESSKNMPETKLESFSSLVNASAPTGFEFKSPESEKDGHLNSHETEKSIEKFDSGLSATSNGLYASVPPAMSFTATPIDDTNKVSTGGAFPFTPSTFASNGTVTSTSANSYGNIFGSVAPATLSGPVSKFGASMDAPAAVSTTAVTKMSDVEDPQAKADISRSSGSSGSLLSSTSVFAAAGSGSSIFGLTSPNTLSTADNLEGSSFGSSMKSSVTGVGTVPQSSTAQSVSSSSLPSFNMNSSTSFGSFLSNSQGFNANITSGFSSSASSSDAIASDDSRLPVSSIAKFGAGSTVLSDNNAVTTSSNASPVTIGFGLNTSSTSTNATGGSSSSATLPAFSFGATASVPASTVTNSSPFSDSTHGVFNFLASSAASTATNSMTSNSAPSNVFGSSWPNPSSSIFGSTNTSQPSSTGFVFGASSSSPNTSLSPSTGFVFGSSSTLSAPTSTAPTMFNSFGAASASALSTPSQSFAQPVFGISPPSFAASPGNTYQMNGEDSMAEDPVQSPAPVFGQAPPSSPFAFGQPVPSQPNPFQFSGQQNQVAPPNPNPFQASSSLEFNAGGGSFSLGSSGVDKSNRKVFRAKSSRNRKK